MAQGVVGGYLENIVQTNSALRQEYDIIKPEHVLCSRLTKSLISVISTFDPIGIYSLLT